MLRRILHFSQWLLIVAVIISTTIPLQASGSVQIPAPNAEIILDGEINEPFWIEARKLSLQMSQPLFGELPTVNSLVKIAYRDGALFIGGKLYNTKPGSMSATQLSRDDLDFSSDLFGVIIDGYNDEENAYAFLTSPSGHKTDLAISNDANTPKNLNWNSYWSVAVTEHKEYWSFEIEIPLSSIQYQVRDEKITLGLSVWRYIAENNEFDTYPLITNQFGTTSYFKPSLTADFIIEDVKSKNPVYLTPYLLGGFDSQKMTAGDSQRNQMADAGFDAKIKLSSSFTIDATVNTDFAQIESDNQQINLTRFPLYQPEKRSFFQERSGLFSFNTGGPTSLFYSRRIGLTEDGQKIPLYGGIRLTGRQKAWDIGIINMQSVPKFGRSSENYGVLRIRRSLSKNTSSYWGLMTTSRIATSGSYNIAYGADLVWEAPKEIFITSRYAHTIDRRVESKTDDWLSNARFLVELERRSYRNLFYKFSVTRVGQYYNPGLGFINRTDFTRYGDRIAYGWFAPENSPIQKYQILWDASAFLKNTTNDIETSVIGPRIYLSLKSGYTLFSGYDIKMERLYEGYSLSEEVYIPRGKYNFEEFFAKISTPEGYPIRLTGNLSLGEFFDGRGFSVTASPEWTITSNFTLKSDLEYYRIDFEHREQLYRSLLVRGRLDFKPSSRISLSTLGQYNNLSKLFSSFLRLRVNITDGSDLFLVYRYGSRDSTIPSVRVNELKEINTIQAKFTYTFKK